ncbi:hypothetical protein TNIN_27801 [Trichonephila inaurata madagascariensis]|uniref:Uncharacterized protein n=1 Tax=Trichonephila inaurata madagascariensis TaxID=2747483 RepID=A0A8X6YD89_9ARAC|nr:hypothetical protein TNIN_27801 [Trichonephila inaurata madagascariensis]
MFLLSVVVFLLGVFSISLHVLLAFLHQSAFGRGHRGLSIVRGVSYLSSFFPCSRFWWRLPFLDFSRCRPPLRFAFSPDSSLLGRFEILRVCDVFTRDFLVQVFFLPSLVRFFTRRQCRWYAWSIRTFNRPHFFFLFLSSLQESPIIVLPLPSEGFPSPTVPLARHPSSDRFRPVYNVFFLRRLCLRFLGLFRFHFTSSWHFFTRVRPEV